MVRQTEIVAPVQVEVLGPDHWDFDGDPATIENALTLTACHPKYSARAADHRRRRAGGRAGPRHAPQRRRRPRGDPVEFEADLSGDRAGAWPAIVWGLICAGDLAGRLGDRASVGARAKWPAYLVGIVPFMVCLFFFFENFSRLLPANY